MNILPINNSVSMQGKPSGWTNLKNHISQTLLDAFPEYTHKTSSRFLDNCKNIDDKISHPAWNRAIMGATAIVTQPLIDRYNPRVEEDTQIVSMNRTIAKIGVGTAVGIVVRELVYKLTEKMTNMKGKSKFSKCLLPKRYLNEISKNEKFLKNYRSAMAMFVALMVMCVTNFAIDAPLTIFFTNLLNENRNKNTGNNDKNVEEVSHAK